MGYMMVRPQSTHESLKSYSCVAKTFEAGCVQAEKDLGSGTFSFLLELLSMSHDPCHRAYRTLQANRQLRPGKMSDMYHVYMDETGFEYDMRLFRIQMAQNVNTRYSLRLFESHWRPHAYCTFFEYIPPFVQTAVTVNSAQSQRAQIELATSRTLDPLIRPGPHKGLLAPKNSSFEAAFRVFRQAFQELTLRTWEERFTLTHDELRRRTMLKGLQPFIPFGPKSGCPMGMQGPPGYSSYDHRAPPLLGLPGLDAKVSGLEARDQHSSVADAYQCVR